VVLTASGQTLLADARAMVEALDGAVRRAQLAGARELRFAATPGAGTVLLQALMTAYRRTKNPATVALDQLIVVVGEGAATRTGSAVTGVPVTGLAHSRLVLVWDDSAHPATGAFLAAASAYVRAGARVRVTAAA
jgi:hypothetical protein